MGLRAWWERLTGGSADRLEREEDAIRNREPDAAPAPLGDYEGIKDDVTTREYEFPGAESATDDEHAR
jgi:hypothetical protein